MKKKKYKKKTHKLIRKGPGVPATCSNCPKTMLLTELLADGVTLERKRHTIGKKHCGRFHPDDANIKSAQKRSGRYAN